MNQQILKRGIKEIKKLNIIIILMIFVNIFYFLIVFTSEGKFYVIKDKNGKIVSFTSQNQISSQDKAAGYTLIEKYGSPEKSHSYGFDDIDWKKMTLRAKEIEEGINGEKEKNLPYPEFSVIATAYTPHEICCFPYADGFTSTNYKAGHGSVAIDPEYGMFFYGDVLYIEGYGIGLANDCGSAIKGKRIDVCFDLGDEQVAMDWGRKKVRVWVLKRGKE